MQKLGKRIMNQVTFCFFGKLFTARSNNPCRKIHFSFFNLILNLLDSSGGNLTAFVLDLLFVLPVTIVTFLLL